MNLRKWKIHDKCCDIIGESDESIQDFGKIINLAEMFFSRTCPIENSAIDI